jgi:hypothetical protein
MDSFLSRPGLRLAGWLLVMAGGLIVLADPPPPVEGGFTIAVIPDSQNYVWKRPELYTLQAGWIAANIERYNLVRVLHVGDVTQHDSEEEWMAAELAHHVFDGLVPAIYAQGNHDMGLRDGYRSRSSRFSDFITYGEYESQPGFGGVYEAEPNDTRNSFHLFESGGSAWLVLALEFAPRDAVLAWANEVVSNHPERRTILLTHAYLRPDGLRFNRELAHPDHPERSVGLNPKAVDRLEGGFNDGEAI